MTILGKRRSFRQRSFRARIHQLILFTTVPLILCVVFLLLFFIDTNREYNNTLTNLSIASSFNEDFHTTLDFKMYQVVVNREMFEELRPLEDTEHAQMIVSRLQETTTNTDSLKRLTDIESYLSLLVGNINSIVKNQGYDQNMRILDRRIRVLTMLVQQKMQEYIHNETTLMAERRDDTNTEFAVIVAVFSGLFLVVILIILFVGIHMTNKLTKPLNELSNNFKTVGEGDFTLHEISVTSNEVSVLHEAFGIMVAKIEELMEHVRREKDNLRLIEFQLMQSQINPHFLYNTFDTIIWLTEDGEYEKVKQMMNSLSNFYRIALSDGEDIITIKEEIKHIQSYLEIQQVRYFDVLCYEIDAPKDIEGYLIPKLTLQPIVENALYHGIKHKRGGGIIQIKCAVDKDVIAFSVRDTGIGMSEEKLTEVRDSINADLKPGYGLVSVFERLRLYYSDDVTFDITSAYTEYTEVKFTIPVR